MRLTVFGYNFPHLKTQNGLFNLFLNGYVPDMVILQDKKPLSFRQSDYRITPTNEYLTHPEVICKRLNIPFVVCDHDSYPVGGGIGVILGARILKNETIKKYDGILNIHPGILPGNRGLDNLKWSLIKNLPIGVTAHFIDYRIDMGRRILTETLTPNKGDSIRDIYIIQRSLEQKVLIDAMRLIKEGLRPGDCAPIEHSEKFDAVPKEIELKYWP